MEKITINGKEYSIDIEKCKEQGLLKEENPHVIDDTKEFIVCAAYKKLNNELPISNQAIRKKKEWKKMMDGLSDSYRKSFEFITGYRHLNILWDCLGLVDQSDGGGFMTSKGRYVDRKEAAEIAFAAGQIEKKVRLLYSEDLY